MAPTALAVSINVADELKSLPTGATATATATEADVNLQAPPSPGPSSPSQQWNPEHRLIKEIAVPPGRLGLKLETIEHAGAVILQIDPACSFRDEVEIGDRIISIDGRAVKELDDLLIGIEKMRIFRIISKGKGGGAHDVDSIAATDIIGAGEKETESEQDTNTLGKLVSVKRASELNSNKATSVPLSGNRKRETAEDKAEPGQAASVKKAKTTNTQNDLANTALTANYIMQQQQRQQQQQEQNVNQLPHSLFQFNEAAIQQQLVEIQMTLAANIAARQNSQQQLIELQSKLLAEAQIKLQREDEQRAQMNIQQQVKNRRDWIEFNRWKEDWTEYQSRLNEHYRKRYEDGWDCRFRELQRYKRDHTSSDDNTTGNVNDIPLDYRDPNNIALGEWAQLQREMYWEGKLDQERMDLLLGEGFDFEHEPPSSVLEESVFTGDKRWDGKLQELIEFKKEFQHTDVPADYPTEQTLGQWVKEQRDLYEAGTLDKEQHILLEQKGFIFEPGTNVSGTVINNAWMRSYKELVQFKHNNGHLEVPTGYKADYLLSSRLDVWIRTQRRMYKQNELPKNKIRLLEEIGLNLTATKKRKDRRSYFEQSFEIHFNELLKYREEHGHVNVPQRCGKLGSWVADQRQSLKRGTLSEVKIRRLVEIGFDFDPLKKMDNDHDGADIDTLSPASAPKTPVFESSVWFDTYEALKSFVETNGHANVPLDHINEKVDCGLHTWLETQKRFFEQDMLPQRQIQLLEELGVDLSNNSEELLAKATHEEAWAMNEKTLNESTEEDDDSIQEIESPTKQDSRRMKISKVIGEAAASYDQMPDVMNSEHIPKIECFYGENFVRDKNGDLKVNCVFNFVRSGVDAKGKSIPKSRMKMNRSEVGPYPYNERARDHIQIDDLPQVYHKSFRLFGSYPMFNRRECAYGRFSPYDKNFFVSLLDIAPSAWLFDYMYAKRNPYECDIVQDRINTMKECSELKGAGVDPTKLNEINGTFYRNTAVLFALAFVMNTTSVPDNLRSTYFRNNAESGNIWTQLMKHKGSTDLIDIFQDVNDPKPACLNYVALKSDFTKMLRILYQQLLKILRKKNCCRSVNYVNVTVATACNRVKSIIQEMQKGIYDDFVQWKANNFDGMWFMHVLIQLPLIITNLNYRSKYFDINDCLVGSAGESMRKVAQHYNLIEMGYPINPTGAKVIKTEHKKKFTSTEPLASQDVVDDGFIIENDYILPAGKYLVKHKKRARSVKLTRARRKKEVKHEMDDARKKSDIKESVAMMRKQDR